MSDRPSPTLVAKDVYRAGRDRLRPLAVYLSRVPAGFPSAANDYVERRLDLNEHLIPRESSTFFVRVAGALDAGRRHPRRRSSGRGPGRGADRRGPRPDAPSPPTGNQSRARLGDALRSEPLSNQDHLTGRRVVARLHPAKIHPAR
jgi:hypothetical protein